MQRHLLVITNNDTPNKDWEAFVGGLVGRGPTEADAVYALYIAIDERELETEEAHE